MFNVFGYLRKAARDAVLGGISDALGEVATDEAPADLDALRKRLAAAGEAKALPPAPTTTDATAPALEPDATTGSKRKKS